MGEHICGRSRWFLLESLNSWPEHGAARIGKPDEKDSEVNLLSTSLFNMFLFGKSTITDPFLLFFSFLYTSKSEQL